MPESARSVLQPDFYAAFSCLGPECRDNCCHDWPIEIDRAAYLRYRAAEDPALRERCRTALRRIKKDGSDERYARMALGSDGRCAFQAEDGGCLLYRQLGEASLSRTCTLYPRRKAEFTPGVWELSLSLSCEQAVRLGVLEPERVVFSRAECDGRAEAALTALPSVGIGKKGRVAVPPAYGAALRLACLRLMQDRCLTVPRRLLAIALLLRRADKCCAAREEANILPLAESFPDGVSERELTAFWEALDFSEEAMRAAWQLPLGHLLGARPSAAQRALYQQLQSLAPEAAPDELCLTAACAGESLRLVRERADPLLAAHAREVENYFVNVMFSSLFPFLYRAEGRSFTEHAILLLEQYALLRVLLTLGDGAQAPDAAALLPAFVHLARTVQHSDQAADLAALSRALHLEGLPHALYFLR